MSGHCCEATGCNKTTKPDQLMCWPHWRLVPRSLANRVYNTWAVRLAGGNASLHDAAKADAIAFVAAKEGR